METVAEEEGPDTAEFYKKENLHGTWAVSNKAETLSEKGK